MTRFLGSLLVATSFLVGCSSSSTDGDPSSSDAGQAATDDAGGSTKDAGKQAPHDAGADAAASAGVVSAGEENKSCADACKDLGQTCTPTCMFNDSLHGGQVGPYAGSGFYSYTTSSGGESFTTNAIRNEASCSTVFSTTWTDNPDDPGPPYTVDYTYSAAPISCCCAP